MIAKYSIWLAAVPFAEIDGSKNRPVLILREFGSEVLCLKMTSQPRKTETDYEVIKWAEAQLIVPTTIITSNRLRLERACLIKEIGYLHPDDIALLRVKGLMI